MSFVPEPWKYAQADDMEAAVDLSAMDSPDAANAPDAPHEQNGTKHTSLFRRYWEKLLQSYR